MPVKNEDKKTFDQRVDRVDPDFKPTKMRKFRRISSKFRMPWRTLAGFAVLFYCAMTFTKVVMENELGPEGFDQKVAQLEQGDDGSKIAAKLLWRDPVMAFVQDKFL